LQIILLAGEDICGPQTEGRKWNALTICLFLLGAAISSDLAFLVGSPLAFGLNQISIVLIPTLSNHTLSLLLRATNILCQPRLSASSLLFGVDKNMGMEAAHRQALNPNLMLNRVLGAALSCVNLVGQGSAIGTPLLSLAFSCCTGSCGE
jgi:hypothetical protein